MKKKTSIIWTIILCIFILYLLYEARFSWSEEFSEPINEETTILSEDKTVFLIFEDKHYGTRRSGFNSLLESLEMWSFDETAKEVKIKYESLLPTDTTQLMIVYDRGYDSFEKHADVLSLSTFPYEYHYKEEPLFKIYSIDMNGNVYLEYKQKRILLSSGESYHTIEFNDFKLTQTTISNKGIYDKEQFKLKEKK